MKLIVQIPCYNEEATIARTIADIPREIQGIDEVQILIIDDGSTDATVQRALEAGADHVISFPANRGLAAAFRAGLEEAVRLGADIVVNTDADNQYKGSCIPDLIRPILEGKADMVVGVRPIETIEDFSWTKKRLQRLGSWVVRRLSKTDVADTTSGFRAYSRDAALRLTVVSSFTYTIETLIQAGRSGLKVAQVPIETNPQTRPSRLFRSVSSYIYRSVVTMLRVYAMYEPLRFFTAVGALIFLPGFLLGVRFLYYYFTGSGQGHVQSLILAAVLMLLGFQVAVLGVVADLIGSNRKIMQDILYHIRRALLWNGRWSPPEGERGSLSRAGQAAGGGPEGGDNAGRDRAEGS